MTGSEETEGTNFSLSHGANQNSDDDVTYSNVGLNVDFNIQDINKTAPFTTEGFSTIAPESDEEVSCF